MKRYFVHNKYVMFMMLSNQIVSRFVLNVQTLHKFPSRLNIALPS